MTVFSNLRESWVTKVMDEKQKQLMGSCGKGGWRTGPNKGDEVDRSEQWGREPSGKACAGEGRSG